MSKIALIAGIALLCGCSPSHTYSTKEGSVTVTEKGKDNASIHITGKDGASVDMNTGQPITDYPADTPLYEGKAVMDMKSGEKHSRVISLQTPDSIEKISAFYKAQLESKGWKTESTMSTPEMAMYVASKENRQLTVTIGANNSGDKLSSISQTLSDK